MKLDDILKSAGRYKKSRRIGRGIGSGRGKTAGRGTKGAGARSGWKQRTGVEGGQNPTLKRIPKRGFTNAPFRREYQVVNVSELQAFEADSRVDAKALAQAGLIADAGKPVKILGDGELTRKLTVVADRFSLTAGQKIVKAGGTAEGEVTKLDLPAPIVEEAPKDQAKEPAKKAKAPKQAKGPKPSPQAGGDGQKV